MAPTKGSGFHFPLQPAPADFIRFSPIFGLRLPLQCNAHAPPWCCTLRESRFLAR